jgi:hypothetical protein
VRIDSFRSERTGAACCVSARVAWEDRERDDLVLFFEAEGPGQELIRPEPDAFLLACALAAMRHGERRISIEGSVCPRLREGLVAAVSLQRSWNGDDRRLPAIEPVQGFRASEHALPARSGAFLSGGLDSLDVFLENHDAFAEGHPGRIEDALHVVGLPLLGHLEPAVRDNFRDRARAAAESFARELGIRFIAVRTNLGEVEPDFGFFGRDYFGSGYAGVAHLFASTLSSVAIASGHAPGAPLTPHGSHPLLDPLFSSSALEIRHEGADRSRLEKMGAAARRPDLVRHLQVCGAPSLLPVGGAFANCGRCPKCLHTLAEIYLAGALGAAASFPPGSLTAENIRTVVLDPGKAFLWTPLSERLRRAGRSKLAAAIEGLLREARRTQAWHEDRGWKGMLRRWDRRFLGGRILAARRRL